jgi:hypothetical protein
MCRSTQSPTLLSNQVADGLAAAHVRGGAWALFMNWRGNQPFADEAVNRARLIEGHQTCDRFTMVGHGHLLAVTHGTEIAAEVVSEFSYACFHLIIMALSGANI